MTPAEGTSPEMEVLTAHRGRRLVPGAAIVAGGVLAVLAAAAVLGGAVVQHRADEALAAASAEAAARTTAGEARVLSTLAYASPMIWSTSVPEGVRADLRALVEATAADASRALAEVGAQAASVTVLPWQGDGQRRQQGVLAVIRADQARFDAIARDARAIGAVLAEPAPSS